MKEISYLFHWFPDHLSVNAKHPIYFITNYKIPAQSSGR